MKYPAMNKRPRQAVVAPDFAGGLNLRNGVSQSADNQLTDCVNMWFKDGALRTRPGISEFIKTNIEEKSILHSYSTLSISNTGINKRNGDGLFELVVCSRDFYRTNTNDDLNTEHYQAATALHFFWVGKEKVEQINSIYLYDICLLGGFFVTQKESVLYAFLGNGIVYRLQDNSNVWEKIEQNIEGDYFYIPTVVTNGYFLDYELVGDALETENIISDYHKIIYSTVNPNQPASQLVNSGVAGSHAMIYQNLNGNSASYNMKDYAGMQIKAVLRNPEDGSKCTHIITLDENGYGEEPNLNEDGYRISGFASGINFKDKDGIVHVTKEQYIKNNLEITFPVLRTDKTKNSVFGAKRSIWFAGGAGGLSGGSRLFLCGNPNEKNIVRWSHRDNPLYWPENNWFEVGDSLQAVTGFGKQENMLVIFKENETYYTQYYQNQDIEATDLTTQNVIDYTSASVYFPLIQLNPNIGCDCPGTVQLCRNRLVWANSNGKVYSLVSANNYSERTIYEVGEMVFNRLCKESSLKNAVSCDWEGHYILAIGNHLYVMDYNSSGYQYAYSYQKNEDGNARIPWYYWELPNNTNLVGFDWLFEYNLQYLMFGLEDSLIFNFFDNAVEPHCFCFSLNKSTTQDFAYSTTPIRNCMQTKLFDFNAPGYYKNVDSVSLTLQNNDGVPIRATFVTDTGTDEHFITLDGAATDNFSPDEYKSVVLHPCIRSYERFGVRLECDSPLAVDGMTLTYRILGGVR